MTRRILLVEDDRVSRESLTYLLRSVGHTVVAAWSAEEARAALDSFRPELALLDIRLPGMAGDIFARHLRHLYPDLPILYVSAETDIDESAILDDKCTLMPKPLDINQLLSYIDNALKPAKTTADARR